MNDTSKQYYASYGKSYYLANRDRILKRIKGRREEIRELYQERKDDYNKRRRELTAERREMRDAEREFLQVVEEMRKLESRSPDASDPREGLE